jgi:hypothetical protein
MIPKILTAALAALLCALSLASCKTTLKPGDEGLYDSKHEVTYHHTSTVYEATALVKEYGEMVLNDRISYVLYTVPGADPTELLATEDYNILCVAGTTMPTLLEMAPTVLRVCVDGSATVREVHSKEDVVAIAALVQTYTKGENLPYPARAPLRSYKVRFESPEYPSFYYTLTYIEYAEDQVIDGKNYGRYFFRSAFEDLFIPVGDEIHRSMGFTD